MARKETINEANEWCNDNIPLIMRDIEREYRRAFMAGYNAAMNEADAHPSEQMLKKAVYLYKRWLTNQSGLNMMEFIKKNWNIEI